MNQYDVHSGGLTAHETVKWFLESLIERGDLPSEDLCKELNVVRFIDYLRERLKDNQGFFDHIEGRAAKLIEKKWETCPHFAVLLFSMARDFLVNQSKSDSEFVQKTSLYRVAKEIYDTFKDQLDELLSRHSNSYEFCSHVFKTGLEIAHFQQDNEWHREYEAFKQRHYKNIRKLQLHYYSVDNPTVFSRRVSDRWKNDVSFADEFNKLENDFQELSPLRLELPIIARSVEASNFASNFVQNLQAGNEVSNNQVNVVTGLAKQFRVVQWEVLLRDLVEENTNKESQFHFYPITESYEVDGIPDEVFLSGFIKKAREIECCFIPSYDELPTKRDANTLAIEESFVKSNEEDIINKIHERHKSFKILLSKIPVLYSFVHKDLVDSFVHMRAEGKSLNTILIEDGEFSFFTLLWLLRYAVKKEGENWESNLEAWVSGSSEGKELTVRFHPGFHSADGEMTSISFDSDWEPSEDDWSTCNIIEFAEECGWIIRLSESKCIPTRRWQSLITWLNRLRNDLRSEYETDEEVINRTSELKYNAPLLDRLKMKRLNYDEEKTSFIKKLWRFLVWDYDASKDPLNQLDMFSSADSVSYEAFTEKLRCLINSLNDASLLTAKSSDTKESRAGLDDIVLLGCFRGFTPLEYLFRAYWPCELHVLLQALNWQETSIGDLEQVPVSLSGATIAGRIEASQDLIGNSENSYFDHWLVPYRSLFSTLGADITLPVVKESSEQAGIRAGTQQQRGYFAHQTSRLLGTVWLDPEKKKLAPESRFALWLAKTHAVEIWGNIPIDVNKKIYDEDFPDWQGDNAWQIVEGLFDFGLRGGVARAASPPKSDGMSMFSEEWQTENKVTEYARELEQRLRRTPDKVKDAIKEVRLSLSFSVPETSPPAWVTTSAFAMCFYHGLRQSVYHALRTFVIVDNKEIGQPCLWIDWDTDSVSIYNRGMGIEKYRRQGSVTTDREFFEIFESKAVEEKNGKDVKVFEINGPEPASNSKVPDRWRFVIRRLKNRD